MNRNNIEFRISAVDAFSKNMNRFQQSVSNMTATTKHMSEDMKNAYKQVKESMDVFKKQQMDVEYQFFKLGQSSDQYAGKTNDLMSEIRNLGKQHKTATDEMIKANTVLRGELYQTAGTFLNMSTQAEKISANYDRMNNPLYKVNQASLAVADGMNKIANSGKSAVLAIKLLGPTANMKALYDMQQMINRGLMRFQMVALGALITSALVYSSLHKAAMDTVKGYEESFNRMKTLVRQAFQPMVDVFGAVMMRVYNVVSAVAALAIKFNEAHPTLAKIIQAVLMLIPALTLLLSPLAIGIGLVAGFHAAFSYLWTIMAPLITGLAAMSATVWLVAAAIVGLVAGFIIAYNKIEWFRNAVDVAMAWIKNVFKIAFYFVKDIVMSIMGAVASFIGDQLAKIRGFWDQNGATLTKLAEFYWSLIQVRIAYVMGMIKTIIQTAWPIIVGIVKIAWALIQSVIGTAIDFIIGLMKVGMALMKGDWSGAWNAIKDTAKTIMTNIIGYFKAIDLRQVGKDIIQGLLNGIESMIGNVSAKVKKVASLIPSGVKKFLGIHSPSRVMMELGGYTAEGLSLGMSNGIRQVATAASGLASAAVPNTSGASLQYGLAGGGSTASTTPANSQAINLTLNYNGSGSEADAHEMLDVIERGLSDRLGLKLRMNGVRA